MEKINMGQAAAFTSPNPLVLVCTRKENGELNMAPVSFVMYTSFNPPMLAFAMGRASNSGENLRRTGKAVIAVPGLSLAEAVMAYGSCSGADTDKLAYTPVELPQTVEAGDHYLYVCNIDGMFADGSKPALFAWDGYTKAAPAAIS